MSARAALLAAVLLAACRSQQPDLSENQPTRQKTLSEKVLRRVAQAAAGSVEDRADAALALGEVVIPGQAPRLRLLAAGDDAVTADGAAVALVRILLLREPDDLAALEGCVRTESNAVVRAQCLRVLAPFAKASSWAVVEKALAAEEAPVREAAYALLAAAPSFAPREAALSLLPPRGLAGAPGDQARTAVETGVATRPVPAPVPVGSPTPEPLLDLLEADEPARQREGLRALLEQPGLLDTTSRRLESALVHALEAQDANVQLLTGAVWLRRSLHVSPPRIDPGVR